MAAIPTKIVTDLEPDDAHQAANTTFDAQDRQYIDTQVRGCQQHLAELLINGIIGTWARVASTSAALVEGDVVCLSGVASGEPTVTLATAAAIAGPGAAYGVALLAASPGARVQLAVDGILPPSVTGLAATAGKVRVSSVGRPERVASFSTGDYPLGSVNALGYTTLSRSTAVGTVSGASTEDVAPTPDTLALRGSSGEVRAARIETSVIRTPAGSDVALQHGETTFAQFRSTDPCAAPGHVRIDATSGQLLAYLTGPGEVSVFRENVRWPKATPDAAPTDTLSIPIFGAPGYYWTITEVAFYPNDVLISDGTSYASMRIRIRDASGSFVGDAAIANTTPSGANSTGDWSEFIPVAFTLDSLLLSLPIDGSHYATLYISKPGSGVSVPAGLLTMTVIPWLGPLP